MIRRTIAATALLCFCTATALAQATSNKSPIERVEECQFTNNKTAWSPTVRRSDDNTFVFNHRDLRSEGDQPYVLTVDEGGYFQVLFKCTAPAFFNYTISGDAAARPDSASGATLPESVLVSATLTTRGVTMRHDSRFLRYHVTATVREGVRQLAPSGAAAIPVPIAPVQPPRTGTPPAAPAGEPQQLYSVAFDVWVITKPDWKLSIIAGVADSSLVDRKYAIVTGADGKETFVENDTQDSRHVDLMALANVYYSQTIARALHAGFAFGIGTSGTSPRFFFGPSLVFGRFFVFTAGWSIGSVTAPPIGQRIGEKPVNGSNTLNTLSRNVKAGSYVGIGFTWIDRRDQFAAALSAAGSASGLVGSCVTSVKPDTITFDASGKASGTVTVEAGADCGWTATLRSGTNQFEIVNQSGAGKGKGEITLKTTAAVAGGRSDVLDVVGPVGSAAKSVKLQQAPPPGDDADNPHPAIRIFQRRTP